MVVIPRRFNGPPDSANGGYACGVAARFIDGPAEVTLRQPPPLDAPLAVESDGERVLLVQDGTLVIESRPATLEGDPPAFVPLEQAREAESDETDFPDHVFPTCFVCGPHRAPGDGLRIFTGAVAGTETVAASWVPDVSLSEDGREVTAEVMWAALDCPSAWAVMQNNATGETMLLGRMTADVQRLARVGEQIVVTAKPLGSDGRKHYAASALYTENGDLLAHARATWITLKR